MELTPGDGAWTVIDKNARTKLRVHEMPDGKQYSLSSQSATPMPKAHALMFLKSPSFEVRDETGRVVAPLPLAEAANERRDTGNLAAGECIARYDELQTAALVARVAQRPGGHAIDPEAPREVLIAFLTRAPTKVDVTGQAVRGLNSAPAEAEEIELEEDGEDGAPAGRSDSGALSTAELLRDVPVRQPAPKAAPAGFGA